MINRKTHEPREASGWLDSCKAFMAMQSSRVSTSREPRVDLAIVPVASNEVSVQPAGSGNDGRPPVGKRLDLPYREARGAATHTSELNSMPEPKESVPMPVPRKRAKKRREPSTLLETYGSLALALVVLLLWQVAVPLLGLSEFVLPTPWAIARRMVTSASLLATHGWYTLLEVVAGFGAAVLTGIPLALAIFYSRVFERAVYPLLVALQTVPKISLAPLLVLYLGYGWGPKIGLAFLISFFPIVIATVVGLQSLDKALVNMVRSMGSSERQTFFKVRLPAARSITPELPAPARRSSTHSSRWPTCSVIRPSCGR